MIKSGIAMRVSLISVGLNIFLAVLKLAAGLFAHSGAMLSDAAHSAADVLATLIVILGVTCSSRASDAEHPYGHERMESIASVVLSIILCLTGLKIGLDGISQILSGDRASLPVPGATALFAAAVSITLKEGMFWYTRAVAARIGSQVLRADAWHHRADALASVGSFAGIWGARMGLTILDPVASVVICLFIVRAGAKIFREACQKLVDRGCDAHMLDTMAEAVRAIPGVLRLDALKTRQFGAKLCVDIELCASPELSLCDAYEIAQAVEIALTRQFPEMKHCMIQVMPGIGTP